MKTPPRRPPPGRALVVLALLAPLVVLGTLHLWGARDLVGFLSGSFVGGDLATLLGLTYVIAWFTCVLVVPVVAIAAVLLSCLRTWRSSRAR